MNYLQYKVWMLEKDVDRCGQMILGTIMGGINLVSVSGYNAQIMGSGYGLNQTMCTRCLPRCDVGHIISAQ